ncbi:MAG: hypothetical protein P9M14_00690 [Candidatus Alcyoniella australis]|nr:hypothetical protein [Candidatus Alcyoniella australis]
MRFRFPTIAGVLLLALLLVAFTYAAPDEAAQTQTTFSPITQDAVLPNAPLTCPGMVLGSVAPQSSTVSIDPATVADALQRLRADNPDAKRELIGVSVPVPQIDPATWEQLEAADGARSWRVAIRSEGATFIRPHFSGLNANLASQVMVYGDPSVGTVQTLEQFRTDGADQFWGPLIQGDVLHIELVNDLDTPPQFRIDWISHGIVEFDAGLDSGEKESWCYLDPTCHSDWVPLKSAVGQMAFESGGGTYSCTGTLLSDTALTYQPWFITANHCISGASEANSLVVTWNYNTSVCNGSAPNFYSLPHSSGSDLKWTNSTYDMTLLMLDSSPPAGAAYLGWSASQVGSGSAASVLHHPAGAYLRLSIGNVVGTYSDFTEVHYREGSTEGGSSGSSLLSSSAKVVGTLSAGDASCSHMSGTDYYGNFAGAYSAGLSSFLNNGSPGDDDDDDIDDDDSEDRDCQTMCERIDQCSLSGDLGINTISECLDLCELFRQSVYECIIAADSCSEIEDCVGLGSSSSSSSDSSECCGL